MRIVPVIDLSDLEDKVDSVISDLSTLEDKVDSVISDLSTLGGKVDSVISDLSTLDGKVDSVVRHMDFWSDVDALVTLPADTALPNIVIADIPSSPTVIRAILILKYSAKKDTSASDNQITAGKITSKETASGTYVDAINLINGEAKVTASTKEGGDVHPGDNDISGSTSGITDNCTVQSVLSGVTTTGASIELYDVQVGIRIYFT